MFDTLPDSVEVIRDWTWDNLQPYFDNLENRDLTADSIEGWLADWTAVADLIDEWHSRSRVKTTQDTTDTDAENYLTHLLDNVLPPVRVAENRLKQKLLASGLSADGMTVALQQMKAAADIFREENIALKNEDTKLGMTYAKITGAQTVTIDGAEKTLLQLAPLYKDRDRAKRQRVWEMEMGRWLQDRESINEVWTKMIPLRQKIAENAGFPNYRAYRWQDFTRFDYSPDDCMTFHKAIEEKVVPAARRISEKRRQRLGVETLRPWDLAVDPLGKPPMKPFKTMDEFQRKASAVFHAVDARAGRYFDTMIAEGLLDLENRKGKGPGAYCTTYAKSKRPFIFGNAVGVEGDLRMLLHEAGHAFHAFEATNLPYEPQREYPIEFAEVASMGMELLAAPYVSSGNGDAFFTEEEARRYRTAHLEKIIGFWPYMAVVDAFQHWAYTHPDDAVDPANCDAKWAEQWNRFMQGVDYSGYEDAMMTGWHRKQHIYRYPFYYVEYGLAQLGAVHVWANALKDQSAAVTAYFEGLALGNTASLPDLFQTAGAKFAFDSATMGKAVDLIEATLAELDG